MLKRKVEDGATERRVGTLVLVTGDVVGKHCTVALETGSRAYDERMALPARHQRLLA